MKKRFPNRVVVERENPNPTGDGAGNYTTGYEKLAGPLWARVESESLSSTEDSAAGQEVSRQRFEIEVRRTPLMDKVDTRDRIFEPRYTRYFDILAVEKTDRSATILFRGILSPVTTPAA